MAQDMNRTITSLFPYLDSFQKFVIESSSCSSDFSGIPLSYVEAIERNQNRIINKDFKEYLTRFGKSLIINNSKVNFSLYNIDSLASQKASDPCLLDSLWYSGKGHRVDEPVLLLDKLDSPWEDNAVILNNQTGNIISIRYSENDPGLKHVHLTTLHSYLHGQIDGCFRSYIRNIIDHANGSSNNLPLWLGIDYLEIIQLFKYDETRLFNVRIDCEEQTNINAMRTVEEIELEISQRLLKSQIA